MPWTIIFSVIGGLFLILFIIATVQAVKAVFVDNKKHLHRFALGLGVPARLASSIGLSAKGDIALDVWSDADHTQLWALLHDDLGLDPEATDLSRDRLRIGLARLWATPSLNLQRYSVEEEANTLDKMAYDASQFVELARMGFALKLLSKEQAWALIFLNAQRMQDLFDSWEGFIYAAVRGRAWILQVTEQEDETPELKYILDELFKRKRSVFSEVAWHQPSIYAQIQGQGE